MNLAAIKLIDEAYGAVQRNLTNKYDAKIASARERHELSMQKKELERNLDNIRVQTLRQIQSFDTGTKQALDDLRYRYASSGISTTSGSGQQNMQYNVSMAALQRRMIQQAGSDEELELQLALIDNRYNKSLNRSNLNSSLNKISYDNMYTWLSLTKNTVLGAE